MYIHTCTYMHTYMHTYMYIHNVTYRREEGHWVLPPVPQKKKKIFYVIVASTATIGTRA